MSKFQTSLTTIWKNFRSHIYLGKHRVYAPSRFFDYALHESKIIGAKRRFRVKYAPYLPLIFTENHAPYFFEESLAAMVPGSSRVDTEPQGSSLFRRSRGLVPECLEGPDPGIPIQNNHVPGSWLMLKHWPTWIFRMSWGLVLDSLGGPDPGIIRTTTYLDPGNPGIIDQDVLKIMGSAIRNSWWSWDLLEILGSAIRTS